MSRKTKFNHIYTPEIEAQFCEQNKFLLKSFIDYLKSVDKSKGTIFQYHGDLRIFFCWDVLENGNKPFTQITKREFAKFQGKALSDWEWSPARIRRVKSAISSLSNFIENILDEEEEFKGFRSIVNKIENPINSPVREKTIFTPEELQKILDTLVENKKYEMACALSLAMNSARRRAELTRFKLSYFSEENVLFGALYKTPEKVTTKGRGSKGKQLNLYVIKKGFDPYLKLWIDDMKAKGIESEWLFPIPTNPSKHIEPESMGNWAEEISELCGKDFYWHCIRHYATTQFLKILPPHIIKEMVGWESVDMVDIYNDTSTDDMLREYFDAEVHNGKEVG